MYLKYKEYLLSMRRKHRGFESFSAVESFFQFVHYFENFRKIPREAFDGLIISEKQFRWIFLVTM